MNGSEINNSSVMKKLLNFCLFLIVRLGSVFLVQTFYVPDEYWQTLEVAHRLTFGYGYLTWEWKEGIRSYFYPLIFTVYFQILKFVNLDYPLALIYGPRIIQAIISAYADLCFTEWTGNRIRWGIFSISTSWFWFYTASRTLINSFECAITTIALSNFPWLFKEKEENTKFLWLVALICVIRPTAVIIWAPLCCYHLAISKYSVISLILRHYIPKGLTIFGISVLLDSIAHGSFIVTPYEFLKFNIVKDIGSWYGSQPWYWYLSAGFPAILGIQFLPFVIATLVVLKNRENHPNELALLGIIMCTIATYSFIPHKEFRFLLPLVPVVLHISSRFLAVWSHKASRIYLWTVAIIIFFGNLGPAYYFSLEHQRGALDVMTPLREIAWNRPQNTSFLFLMPCHSTPYYSYLHVNVTARFLTCEPNINNTENYIDEADRFYNAPMTWLRKHYPPNGTLPSHIICYDNLEPIISDILTRYKRIHSIYHTNFPSTRIGRNIVINEKLDF